MNISFLCLSKREVRKEGFTIVELLVVIAIILFLTALLMPALSRVRETAKVTKCISNLRQLYIATYAYAADYDGKAPFDHLLVIKKWSGNEGYFVSRSHDPSDSTFVSHYPQNKWFAEYLGGGAKGRMNEVGYCPKGGRIGEMGANPTINGAGYPNYSYGINPDLVTHDWFIENEYNDRTDIPLVQTPDPSGVSLWIEAVRSRVYEKNQAITGRHYSKEKIPNGDIVGNRSVYQSYGKANVIFLDGHVGFFNFPNEYPAWNCHFFRWWSKLDGGCSDVNGSCGFCDSGKCGHCAK